MQIVCKVQTCKSSSKVRDKLMECHSRIEGHKAVQKRLPKERDGVPRHGDKEAGVGEHHGACCAASY